MTNASEQEATKINKRVYFICGFDTRGVRFYHRLFREEARKSQKHSGIHITVSKPIILNNTVSQSLIHAQDGKKEAFVDYRHLVWDDVVNQLWFSSQIKLLCAFIPIFFKYLLDGTHHKIRKAGNGAYLLIMYPFWFVFFSFLITTLVTSGVFLISMALIGNLIASIAITAFVAFCTLKRASVIGEKSGAWFMMQNYVFYTHWGRKPIAILENRLDVFAQQIIDDYLQNPNQDILFVTHCTGGTLAMPIMARLIEKAPSTLFARLTLITLGQCIPFLTYNPNAKNYRESIQKVVNAKQLNWVDIGARVDPFSFDEVNPSVAEGMTNTRTGFPAQYIIRPSEMYSPEVFAQLKNQKLRLHFQYLMTSDIAVNYDFFEMVTQSEFDFSCLEKAKIKPIT